MSKMSNNRPPLVITGQQSKHFNDGVVLVVHYTRNGSSIRSIDTVDVTYNSETLCLVCDCEYNQFLRESISHTAGGKQINIVPRVRAVMDDITTDFESIDERTSVPLDESWTHIAETSDGNVYFNGNVAPDNEYTFDGADYVVLPEAQELPPPTPKRKRTRWELLELD